MICNPRRITSTLIRVAFQREGFELCRTSTLQTNYSSTFFFFQSKKKKIGGRYFWVHLNFSQKGNSFENAGTLVSTKACYWVYRLFHCTHMCDLVPFLTTTALLSASQCVSAKEKIQFYVFISTCKELFNGVILSHYKTSIQRPRSVYIKNFYYFFSPRVTTLILSVDQINENMKCYYRGNCIQKIHFSCRFTTHFADLIIIVKLNFWGFLSLVVHSAAWEGRQELWGEGEPQGSHTSVDDEALDESIGTGCNQGNLTSSSLDVTSSEKFLPRRRCLD